MRNSFLTLISLALLLSCSKEETSTSAPPPAYQTLHTEKTLGAFFQLQHDGEHFIVSSVHQGGAAPGAQLFREGQKDPVILKKRVHLQKDLHLWTYDQKTLSPDKALIYHPDTDLKKGDRIFILNRGQKIPATIMAEAQGEQFRYSYKTDAPFPAGGMSGSPVYLPRTGSVVGVLQPANDKLAANFGGFEKLELP
jgi:hypothetical protein